MKGGSVNKNLLVLLGFFIVSRIIVSMLGVRFNPEAIEDYWQYLDVQTLQNNLLSGIWYQSAQPPLFNLVIGSILKLGGRHGSFLFAATFMGISLINAVLLLVIIQQVTQKARLSLLFALLYMLAPATILYENELFYTSFISLFLLLAVYFLLRMQSRLTFTAALCMFTSLAFLCLTKSFYHLAWLIIISVLIIIHWFPKPGIKKLVLASIFPLCLVAAWYGKNLWLFAYFSTTTWTGMNLARVVFHENRSEDSSSIASLPPFYPISTYSSFIREKPASGTNDQVLRKELKNGRHINLFHQDYLQVSRLYLNASKKEIKRHPLTYGKNVLSAAVIFFTPASSYFKLKENERRIRFYDALCSLNISAFIEKKSDQKTALALAGLVMAAGFICTFFYYGRWLSAPSVIPLPYLFMLFTIIYTLLVSSCFEYGENMRFRFEIQPLFLILFAAMVNHYLNRNSIPSSRT